jgi:adenylate cyclase
MFNCYNCERPNKIEAESSYFPRIMVIQGLEKGKEFPFGDTISIGRDPSNYIQLRDGKVSREHARIACLEGQYFLEDLSCVGKSGNGTYKNGQKIDKAPLQDKDLIKVADNVFMFRNTYAYTPQAMAELLVPQDTIVQDAVISDVQSGFAKTRAELKFDAQRSFLANTEELHSTAALETANTKLRILYDVNHAIGSILDLQELLGVILDVVFRYIPAERGAILLYDAEKDSLQSAVTKARAEQASGPIKISRTMTKRAVEDRVSLLTTDTLLDDEFASAQSIITQGIRAAMTVPLISKQSLLGLLHVDTTQKSSEFNSDALELLTEIAGQAAIAIENAKLIQKIEKEVATRNHLQRYLASELVDQILNNQLDFKIGGQLKKATILFTDLRGFTKLTETIGAEAVVAILNDYFSRMVDIIFSNHGTLDKFIGDAIMAVWGIPIGHPADALRSVKASIEMQQELFYFNLYQRKKGRSALKMGAAINTGEVVVGNMGSPKRMEYTVIGPPVNLASRTEGLTGHNHVLVTENTYAEIKDRVEAVELPYTTPLKGINRMIKIFCIISMLEESGNKLHFLPVVLQVPGQENKYEALLQLYQENSKILLDSEPGQTLQPGTAVTLFVDIPSISPGEQVKIVINKRETATHGQEEYFKLEAQVQEMPATVQKFLQRVFA